MTAGGMVTIDYPDLSRRVIMLPERGALTERDRSIIEPLFTPVLDALEERLRPRYHDQARRIAALLLIEQADILREEEDAYERVCARKGLLPL